MERIYELKTGALVCLMKRRKHLMRTAWKRTTQKWMRSEI